MKTRYYLLLSFAGFVLAACNNNVKHPQADVVANSSSLPETEESILQYADSIDAQYNNMEKKVSLVYQLNGQSLYVEKLSWNGKAVQYIAHNSNEGMTEQTTKYYLKDDSLLLVSINSKSNASVFEEKRTYLRKNIPFSQEHRLAGSFSSLRQKPFVQIDDTGKSDDYEEKIAFLNDALMEQNKFEMVFDQFISSPEGKYLLQKSKIPGGYSSSVLVKNGDALTDSLEVFPDSFKEARLNFKWEIQEKQAVYVPVAASITSASGLKR